MFRPFSCFMGGDEGRVVAAPIGSHIRNKSYFVFETQKIGTPQKIIVPKTIKGVLWPSKVLELLSSSSSYCPVSLSYCPVPRAIVQFLELLPSSSCYCPVSLSYCPVPRAIVQFLELLPSFLELLSSILELLSSSSSYCSVHEILFPANRVNYCDFFTSHLPISVYLFFKFRKFFPVFWSDTHQFWFPRAIVQPMTVQSSMLLLFNSSRTSEGRSLVGPP